MLFFLPVCICKWCNALALHHFQIPTGESLPNWSSVIHQNAHFETRELRFAELRGGWLLSRPPGSSANRTSRLPKWAFWWITEDQFGRLSPAGICKWCNARALHHLQIPPGKKNKYRINGRFLQVVQALSLHRFQILLLKIVIKRVLRWVSASGATRFSTSCNEIPKKWISAYRTKKDFTVRRTIRVFSTKSGA